MSRDRDASKESEDFASRWSRLKRGTKGPVEETPEPAADAPAPEADARSDEEILRELGLPDPDTLKAGDDFKRFMSSAVPARIRNRALRRLWTSNPVLANLDRLVDYDDDFTDAAMVPALLKTGYKVGRGWLDDPAEKEAEPEKAEAAAGREEAGAEEAAPEAGGTGDGGSEAPEAGTQAAAVDGEADRGGGEPDGAEPDGAGEQAPEPRVRATRAESREPPRRMRFRFTEG